MAQRRATTATSAAPKGSGGDSVLIRITVPDQDLQKCLLFNKKETVWHAKQSVLDRLAQTVPNNINYGLYLPPVNGQAGRYLSEERMLGDYRLPGPVAQLQFKYKRRVYTTPPASEKTMSKLHSRAGLKKFFDAVAKRNYNKVKDMLERGLDPNFQDEESGEAPLTLSAKVDDADMLRMLYEGGAHLDFRAKDGATALHKATVRGGFKSVERIFQLGGSPDMRDNDGLTALHQACINGGGSNHVRAVQMLLKQGCEVGFRDQQGWTELHHAAKNGHEAHVELLLMYQANINAVNRTGNTALHVCATWDQAKTALVLLRRGASTTIKNRAGQAAADVAMMAGSAKVATVLQTFDPRDVAPHSTAPVYAEGVTPPSRKKARPNLHAAVASVHELDVGDVRAKQLRVEGDAKSRHPTHDVKLHDVTLAKGVNGFGFRLSGATHSAADQNSQGQWVRAVDLGGEAERAGLVAGDRLMELNGVDVSFWSHRKVVDEVKRSGDVIQLRVARRLSSQTARATGPAEPARSQAMRSQSGPMQPVRPKMSAVRTQSLSSTQTAASGLRPPISQQSAPSLATFSAAPRAPAAPVASHSVAAAPQWGQRHPNSDPPVERLLATKPVSTNAQVKPPSPPRTSSLSPASSPKTLRRNQSAPIPAPPPPPPGLTAAAPLARRQTTTSVVPAASAPRPPMGDLLKGLQKVQLKATPTEPQPTSGAAALPDFLKGLHDIKLKKTPKASGSSAATQSNASPTEDGGVAPGARLLGIKLRNTGARLSGYGRERSNSVGESDLPSRQASIRRSRSPTDFEDARFDGPGRPRANSLNSSSLLAQMHRVPEPEDDAPPPPPKPSNSSTLVHQLRKANSTDPDLEQARQRALQAVRDASGPAASPSPKVALQPPRPAGDRGRSQTLDSTSTSSHRGQRSRSASPGRIPPQVKPKPAGRPIETPGASETTPAVHPKPIKVAPPPPPAKDKPALDIRPPSESPEIPTVPASPPSGPSMQEALSSPAISSRPLDAASPDFVPPPPIFDAPPPVVSPTAFGDFIPPPPILDSASSSSSPQLPPPPSLPAGFEDSLSTRESTTSILSTSSSEDETIEPHRRPSRNAPPPPSNASKPKLVKLDEQGRLDDTPDVGLAALSARVVYPYQACFEDELSLEHDQLITLLKTPDGGWWRGKTKTDSGWFPSNYVRPNTMQAMSASDAQRRMSESSTNPLTSPTAATAVTTAGNVVPRLPAAVQATDISDYPASPPASSATDSPKPSIVAFETHPSGLPLAPTTWSVEQVGDFLRWLELGQYAEAFGENEIDGEQLVDLDKEELKELTVTALGHRKKLLKALDNLKSSLA
eukprot:m.158209 g.158209  ORF g.158209 m.158209 type:complete len:1337 (+) comp16462_c0_seq1:28-4038(+)